MTEVREDCVPARQSILAGRDLHSFSEPEKFAVRHIDLELKPRFDRRILEATVVLKVERRSEDYESALILDTRDLTIQRIETANHIEAYKETRYELGSSDPILGTPLIIQVPIDASYVRITYCTSSDATALQWLDPAQTAAKQSPFLYTQSQEIHARSWLPLQDTPAVRLTYSAHVETPKGLLAVMSAENNPEATRSGSTRFEMNRPIPPYLIALGVGDLEFESTSERTGVYAEKPLIKRAAYEFAEAEKMLEAAEQLYGPYLWGRFDTLVLPPSFPFGGMENPCLIFVSPTLIAGDRSSVSVIAHELAHAWSGNLVTNATWSDFWLNEGFTTYLEYRIQERLYGRSRALMEQVIAQERLHEEMGELDSRDQILHIDLAGRDPDCGATLVPYVKGALFLKCLEEVVGDRQFDEYLKSYFSHFQFRSITTQEAMGYLKNNLLNKYPDVAAQVPVEEWISQPGIPSSAPRAVSKSLARVKQQAQEWQDGNLSLNHLRTRNWSKQEWLYFLRSLPADLIVAKMKALDDAFQLTRTSSTEILHQWLLMAVRSKYEPAYPRTEEFLSTVGRRVYIKPIYEELMKTEAGKKFAREIYARVRNSYHPIVQSSIDKIVSDSWNAPGRRTGGIPSEL
jgi:leukotriene-A4 hydrolase